MESHIALAAEKLFQIGPIPITNSILTTWVVTFILIVFALVSTRKIAAVPSSLQNFAEILVESFQNLVASIAEDKTKIFLPIVASFFFFILLGNYFGLLPGFGTIGFFRVEHGQKIFVPLLRSMKPERGGYVHTKATRPNTNAMAISRQATVMGWITAATAMMRTMAVTHSLRDISSSDGPFI